MPLPSLARHQRPLPEIVEDYRQFVRDVCRKYTVIIAIDELDKIASDEMAQQFMNEIKVLFGLEQCFYLLSICLWI